MKFEIKNRWTGEVKFTAEINCAEDASYRLKIGLAVKWALETDANLTDADLTRADLTDANLTRANLTDANLTRANLTRANLTRADLTAVRADFLAEVLKLPNELEYLRDALIAGKVDGSTYTGECACLAGTLAHARGIANYSGQDITNGCTFKASCGSPRERFFPAIPKGATPENNSACKIALEWTNEAIAIRDNIRAHVPTI